MTIPYTTKQFCSTQNSTCDTMQFTGGIADATSTNNFKHLFDNFNVFIQCMFCNMVTVFVLGPGPTGCN